MSAGWGWSVVLDSIRYRFVSRCSSELAAKCNLAGAGVGSVVQVGVWSASIFESSIFEFRRPIRIPTTNSHK